MNTKGIIKESLGNLESYILDENFKGYDPYDALKSPVFKLPVLNKNRLIRISAQQILRRLHYNIRPILGIKKSYNPVTLGLAVQAFTYLEKIFPDKKDFYRDITEMFIEDLQRLVSTGCSGACWGYNFDWEAKFASFPAYTPTVVATGFITNALFINFRITGNKTALGLCESAADFVRRDLKKSYEGSDFCYSYSPRDEQRVFNASMKGARILAQVYSVTKNKDLKIEAESAVRYVVRKQRENGSWGYSEGDGRDWSDNFHTGYVLDCLHEYMILTGHKEFAENLERGFSYYVNNFFINNCIPKYYDNKGYPIDTASAAQSALTFVRFGKHKFAGNVLLQHIADMQDIRGYFYYQRKYYRRNKISYMRWSNVWMYAAMAYYLYAESGSRKAKE